MNKKLISVISIIVLMLSACPFYALASDDVDIGRYLFRYASGVTTLKSKQTTKLTFTPQYSAKYTLVMKGHDKLNGGINIKGALYDSNDNILVGEVISSATVSITYYLNQGEQYYYTVRNILGDEPKVDITFTSAQTDVYPEQATFSASLAKTTYNSYNYSQVYSNLIAMFYDGTNATNWVGATSDNKINGVDLIFVFDNCGHVGENTIQAYYMGYNIPITFTIDPSATTTTTTQPTTTTTTQPTTTTTTTQPTTTTATTQPTTTTTQPTTTTTTTQSIVPSVNTPVVTTAPVTYPVAPTTTAATVATTSTTTAIASKKPSATSIKKLSAGRKQFKITYKKISSSAGYRVQYSTSKKFTSKTTKSKTVKGAKKTSYTVKKLKSKKKYYVRVQTYKIVKGKKVYSKWSKVKTVKTK